MSEAAQQQQVSSAESMAKVIYILYLVGIVVGITLIVGVIMAYVKRSDAPEWLQRHFQFQIRTFWIGLLYSVIGMILTPVLVGFLVFLFVLVWLVIRCVKGLTAVGQQQAPPNVEGWLF